MSISRPSKFLVSGLIFALLLALALPKLPYARSGQSFATWDVGSYVCLSWLFVPLLCIWFAAGRNKFIEAAGWVLLLLNTVGALVG